MAIKYDIFELLFKNQSAMKPQEIALIFPRTTYDAVYSMLRVLEKESLVYKHASGFHACLSLKSKCLYNLILFCIQNGINYNDILDKNVAAFISKALLKRSFTAADFKLNPRTFAKCTDVLYKNGFLLVLSRKPMHAVVFYNSFLRDLLHYFGQKVLVAKLSEEKYATAIQKELLLFKRLRRMNERKYEDILRTYEIKFIHHSLNLEGNPITLPETIKLLKEHVVPKDMAVETVEEVNNYQKAIYQMLRDADDKRVLTQESILHYHYLAMQHKPHLAGKIRAVEVFIRNNPRFKAARVQEIVPKLAQLLEKYNNFVYGRKHTLTEIIAFAGYFHNEFQHIHPFEDGNSRTTRLLTFHLLRSQDIPIIDIPLGLLEEYVSFTKGAKKRDDKQLTNVLQRIIYYNVRMLNEQLS